MTSRKATHAEIVRSARGRVERMIAGGAPAWLIEAEREAQRQGFTMRRLPGLGPEWYRVPLESDGEFSRKAVADNVRRLERERRVHTMAPVSAYRAAAGFTRDPDEFAGVFDNE